MCPRVRAPTLRRKHRLDNRPGMTRPNIYLVRMAVFLVAVAIVAAVLSPVLLSVYSNNPVLNSLILLVLLIGVAWNLRQVLRLSPEVTWLETYQNARANL